MKRAVIAVLAITILISGACVLRGQRHQTIRGTVFGNETSAPVSIIYDHNGVPHVIAKTDPDLFYGLGYAMAQDRFFYMDTMRKFARGETGALFGRLPHYRSYDLVNMSRLARSLDFAGRARQGVTELDPETRAILSAYTRGVNRYLRDAGRDLPEYRALGLRPEPWTEEDAFVCMDLYGLTMTLYSFFIEYYSGRLVHELGPERAQVFIPEYPATAPYINEDYLPSAANDRAVEALLAAGSGLAALLPLGSNNWVVDGAMSASGKPIVSNDPHVPTFLVPTLWYHVHLKGGSFDAAGMMFSGIPLLGAGTNGYLAWGITNARCDYFDVFVEKLNPDNPNQYWYRGEWRDFELVQDRIPIKGGADARHFYRRSVHGPVIEPQMSGITTPQVPGQVLTIHLAEVELGRFFAGYLNIPRARDAAAIKAAVSDMAMGPVAWNTVFGTVDGDIGYLYSGHAAIRPDNQGVLPRPGTGEADWQGWLDFDQLPHVLNPRKHFIVTANNKVEPPGYPHYLCSGYALPSRSARITELLTGRSGLTVTDMLAIQMDVKVMSAQDFAPLFIADLEGSSEPGLVACREALEEWRDQGWLASLDARGPGVYKLMMKEMGKLAFSDELGPRLVNHLGMADMVMPALWRILPEPDNAWFDDVNTPERETRRELSHQAAAAAAKYLTKHLGKDPAGWSWGEINTLYLRSLLGLMPWNRGPRLGKHQMPGDEETVNNSSGLFIAPLGFLSLAGPSSRMSVDLAEPRHFYYNATTGNAEDPDSPFFANPTENWLQGTYRMMSLDPAEFMIGAMGELRLEP